ncbi:aminoglycoside phosphotransferase family protein [Wenxinia marina]|uniref:Putative phosphotransferase n=1 Tax=Wenxinia marina DSM 24838 TaxID=1123501 RepID=A0A0D0QFL2_9RHOB|nr:phosphotransferase [Wenxinia marina]KIQ71082.1 putative phosphotransferase [Wenxinia marina DSM 24838]GGL55001.1 aminoglycoside phosphotransferase [Wenxinia marina]
MIDVEAFLAAGPTRGWTRTPLAGDASARRYERLTAPDGRTRVLMIAPAGDASTHAFVRVTAHLRDHGLSAPEILDAAPESGLLLLEDLGPTHCAAHLSGTPDDEVRIADAVADLLAALDALPVPEGLARMTPEVAGAMLAPLAHHAPRMPVGLLDEMAAVVADAVEAQCGPADRFSLRDCHAENVIWRPGRTGHARLGLLDYQDAVAAPRGYDLASWIADARRDVPPAVARRMTERLASALGMAPQDLAAAVAVLQVQRNLRILGIFARLAREEGKRRYLAFLPRVRAHVEAGLAHPALAELRPLVHEALATELERSAPA